MLSSPGLDMLMCGLSTIQMEQAAELHSITQETKPRSEQPARSRQRDHCDNEQIQSQPESQWAVKVRPSPKRLTLMAQKLW